MFAKLKLINFICKKKEKQWEKKADPDNIICMSINR